MTTRSAAFRIERLESVVAPSLCSDILDAAAEAGSVKSGLLGLVTFGGWGWTLLVCTAAS